MSLSGTEGGEQGLSRYLSWSRLGLGLEQNDIRSPL